MVIAAHRRKWFARHRQLLVDLKPASLTTKEAMEKYWVIFGDTWQYAQVLLLLAERENSTKDKFAALEVAQRMSESLFTLSPASQDVRVSLAQVHLNISDAYMEIGQKEKAYEHMKALMKTGFTNSAIMARFESNKPDNMTMSQEKKDIRKFNPDPDKAKEIIEALPE